MSRPNRPRVGRRTGFGRPTPAHLMIALSALLAAILAPIHSRDREAGMTTAEYAVGTIAAAAFAAILYQVVTGDSIVSALGSLISKALSSL